MNNLVSISNGKPITNSVLVAEKFGKQHKHVISAIDEIIQSAEFSADCKLFDKSIYYDNRNRPQPLYLMDRDGFSLLVMGFTGKQAMKFKLDFIGEFNKMETELRSQLKPLTPAELLLQQTQLLVEQERKINLIESRVDEIEARTTTRSGWFTIVGYATRNKIACGLTLASKLGRKASSLCKLQGIEPDEIPDPRFGRVKVYPPDVLKEVFESPI